MAHIKALDVNGEYSFDLGNFKPLSSGWENYVMGVVHELQELGADIKGFDASFTSDVPIGSGMSSSAALECSLASGLNRLFDLGLNDWQIIKASQKAEHNFVGIKCGIMDQFSSMMGKKDHVMLLDCRSLEYKYYPLKLNDYEILLLNTNVSHALANSEYNLRRATCEEGVHLMKKRFADIRSLRDLNIEMFSEVESILPKDVAIKCKHVIYENERVLLATHALAKNDFKQLGKLMYESHHSLQHDYDVSCPELDYLVDQTKALDYVLGSRMMGGGFGGCTINLIHKNSTSKFIDSISEKYYQKYNVQVTPYLVQVDEGAQII